MNALTAKTGLQVVGTLNALSCLHFIGRTYVLASVREWTGLVFVALLVPFFAYVGYLTWLKFSPRAIRYICGATAFWMFWIVRAPTRLVSQTGAVRGLLDILLIAVLVWVYRRAWRSFSSLIFIAPESRIVVLDKPSHTRATTDGR